MEGVGQLIWGMGSPIGSPGQWLCPNNCRIALNTLVKIQTMVVKIINTIVEVSNSQMLKYAGHSEQRAQGRDGRGGMRKSGG